MKTRMVLITLSLALLAIFSTVSAQPNTDALFTNGPTLFSANLCSATITDAGTEPYSFLTSPSGFACFQCAFQWELCMAGCSDQACLIFCSRQFNHCLAVTGCGDER